MFLNFIKFNFLLQKVLKCIFVLCIHYILFIVIIVPLVLRVKVNFIIPHGEIHVVIYYVPLSQHSLKRDTRVKPVNI